MITLPEPERTGELVHDGRRIGWAEWGEPDGRPVLLCTGAAMTSSLGLADGDARAAGVRLVCIDRAGLGRSAPHAGKSFATWSDDVRAVLGGLGLASPAAIGFSQGGPFALALAAGGLVASVALVAAQDELASPALRPQLLPDIASLVDAIAADRAAFEAQLAARADASGMLELVLAMSSPHDRAIYTQPAFAAAYRRTLEHAFAQGAAGYVRDLVLAMSPWPMRPETITVPVALWYGQLDTSPVHSPDHGATLAARLPRATRRLFADEGGSLLWTRGRELLSSLVPR